ncbi:MAG: hypothetical protein JWO73_387, partial [Candidatus Taylorbacteria bacterium]|nr:hypothetical protein [Candidatus Taylorbacteria bacterium]
KEHLEISTTSLYKRYGLDYFEVHKK